MKAKIRNLLLIVTSLIGYLSWGGGNQMFLFEGEAEVMGKLVSDPLSVAHPFILLPLVGQILLLITLFQPRPSRLLTILGMSGIGVLLLMICLIGILTRDVRIFLSAVPFLFTAIITVRHLRQK